MSAPQEGRASPGSSGSGGAAQPSAAESRALLARMLEVLREQRRHLIEGNVAGLAETSALLHTLVEMAGGKAGEGAFDAADGELGELAERVRTEGRINYLLACRGARFAEAALSVARAEASAGSEREAEPSLGAESPRSPISAGPAGVGVDARS